jgi:hypothetical protein
MMTRWISAASLSLSLLLQALPAGAQNVATPRQPSRTAAHALANQAAANASNAAGNPYVNPQAGNRPQSSQNSAVANANAAEMRSAHVNTAP